MTRQRVASEKGHVREEQDASEAEPQAARAGDRRSGDRLARVEPQEEQRDEGEIQEIAMDVLEDERERRLERVAAMDGWLADGAARRVREVEAVIGLPVVVAGRPEAERHPQDQQARADPRRQPVRDDQRREEWRQIAVHLIRGAEQRRPDDAAEEEIRGTDREEDALDAGGDPSPIAPARRPETRPGRSRGLEDRRARRHRAVAEAGSAAAASAGSFPPPARRSMIASANSLVPASPPRSYVVRRPSAITPRRAVSTRSAAAGSPRWRSIRTPLRISAVGFALLRPAYFGAEPWTASNTAASVPMLAPGATPSPPTRPAHRSLTMSP